jgi:superfamily II DNA or RNA helicase
MSDSSSPPPSPTASINDAKRVEDDVSIDSAVGSELDDLPDAEKDTVVIKPLDEADNRVFKLRAYQDEMLAESLQRNTIIVLDTGAGKTHM